MFPIQRWKSQRKPERGPKRAVEATVKPTKQGWGLNAVTPSPQHLVYSR